MHHICTECVFGLLLCVTVWPSHSINVSIALTSCNLLVTVSISGATDNKNHGSDLITDFEVCFLLITESIF